MGYSKKNPYGGLRIWNFQGYQRNGMWNFHGLIKNEVDFPRRVTKKKCGISWGLCLFLFVLGISKGSNTIL